MLFFVLVDWLLIHAMHFVAHDKEDGGEHGGGESGEQVHPDIFHGFGRGVPAFDEGKADGHGRVEDAASDLTDLAESVKSQPDQPRDREGLGANLKFLVSLC